MIKHKGNPRALANLDPLANAIASHNDKPIAVTPKYDGEYGYALRLIHHIDVIPANGMTAWLEAHPNGVVITRRDKDMDLTRDYTLLHTQAFRLEQQIALIGKK